jgi:galactose oxidase
MISRTIRQHAGRYASCVAVAIGLSASFASAEVTNVYVGVTPTCPYGIVGCWSGARAALAGLKGVTSPPHSPDAYNCTAEVHFSGPGLPDVDQWEAEFKKSVGDVYGFRGVEVTVTGFLSIEDGKLLLRSADVEQPIVLAPLQHKLQYNFRKKKDREAEAEEQAAYSELLKSVTATPTQKVAVEIVGILHRVDSKPTIEVREAYLLAP